VIDFPDKAVSVVGDVVFGITVAAVSDLYFGAVGVGGTEVGDANGVAGVGGVVLGGVGGTAWRGLRVPMPA
jgi:hypothetical protein